MIILVIAFSGLAAAFRGGWWWPAVIVALGNMPDLIEGWPLYSAASPPITRMLVLSILAHLIVAYGTFAMVKLFKRLTAPPSR